MQYFLSCQNPIFWMPNSELNWLALAGASVNKGFLDVEYVIDDLICEGDRVAVRWTFQGTRRGDSVGTKASGVRVTQTGNVSYQFRDWQICGAWLQVDRLGFLQQGGGSLRRSAK